MTRLDHRLFFLLAVIFLIASALTYPDAMSDKNRFMKDFVDSPLLSVLGFLTAVTVAAAGNTHFQLNRLTDETGKRFHGVRRALLNSITSMVAAFAFAIAVVVSKPLLPTVGLSVPVANALAMATILFDLSILLDIARTVFKIPSASEIDSGK